MQIKTVVALASTIGCAFAYPICSFAGNYQAEDGSSQSISFNGMFFNRTQDGVAIYFDETAQLHCMGNTAYLEQWWHLDPHFLGLSGPALLDRFLSARSTVGTSSQSRKKTHLSGWRWHVSGHIGRLLRTPLSFQPKKSKK
jgi:hypothetical protein